MVKIMSGIVFNKSNCTGLFRDNSSATATCRCASRDFMTRVSRVVSRGRLLPTATKRSEDAPKIQFSSISKGQKFEERVDEKNGETRPRN